MQNIITLIFDTCLGICLLFLIIQLIYLILLSGIHGKQLQALDNYPSISILVAARNEAHNIIECLQALNAIEYEDSKIEILIGNDMSTDYTRMLVENFIKDKPKFRLFNLDGKEFPTTKGKARVLAVLAAEAKGEYFLITDADIEVNPLWAKGLVSMMVKNSADMCGGTTNISTYSMFSKFQQVDWLYFMGIIHSYAAIGKPLTVVGNNMGVSKKAYLDTGGYAVIPFSVTEDYALLKAVQKKGYKIAQELNVETMVYSKPLDSIKAVLKQRKRWLVGGWDLPFYYQIMMFIFGAWYFALPVLFCFHWRLALLFLVFKDLFQLIQLLIINKHLKLKVENPMAVIFYEFYLIIMIPLTSIFFLLPTSTSWKGRKY